MSVTADIVCHHHNGVGFKNMPAGEKNKSCATAQMQAACLSVRIFCRHVLMKTNYSLSAGTETAIELDSGADRASMKI